jgi:hypothetical protein
MTGKPTVTELGIDPAEVEWKASGKGPGTIEVAFVSARGTEWVLLQVRDNPDELVSVFTRFEWECFLDGAKSGEFDDPAR